MRTPVRRRSHSAGGVLPKPSLGDLGVGTGDNLSPAVKKGAGFRHTARCSFASWMGESRR